MGHLRAVEAATTMTDFAGAEAAMSYHLTANHYPPVPESMVPVCLEAVRLAADEDWEALVDLPDGITYKGLSLAPVHKIVSQHHLEPFVWAAQGEFDEEE